MKRKRSPDSTLIIVTFILLGIGLVMVFSSSYHQGLNRFNDSLHFIKLQLIYAGIGLIAMYITSNFNFWQWKRFIILFFFLNFILLVVVLIPGIGVEIYGARRWLNLGFMRFQPSDFTKFALILFAANYMSKKERLTKFFSGIIPLLAVVGLSLGLIMLQPDLGTTVAIGGTIGIMLFAAGAKMSHLLFLGSLSLPAVIYLIFSADYRLARIFSFLDPWADPTGSGWQIIQSLYGIAGGGLLGVGLGNSRQTTGFLPEPQNDFIFSIICEELGLLGALFVLLLFVILVWRGFNIAIKIEDTFGSFLAMGLTTMIALQVIINVGVVTSSMPTTGITLPLISYGGTSLIITLASIGIILNVSRYIN